MKVHQVQFPHNSQLYQTEYAYSDSYEGTFLDKKGTINPSIIGKAFFNSAPRWVGLLFIIRNKIVSLFGLKTSMNKANRQDILDNFECNPGERVGLFKVYERSEKEVILGEDDKHLNFRISLLKEDISKSELKKLTITTTVKFNNQLGKTYFLFVKPFHRHIVPSMLKATIRQIPKVHDCT